VVNSSILLSQNKSVLLKEGARDERLIKQNGISTGSMTYFDRLCNLRTLSLPKREDGSGKQGEVSFRQAQ